MGDPCILQQVVHCTALICNRMSQSRSSSRGYMCNCHWDRAHLIAGRFRD